MAEKTKLINMRVSEDLYNSVINTVAEIQNETPRGATANRNTVLTRAVEDFIHVRDKEKKGVITYEFNPGDLNELTIEELSKLHESLELKGYLGEVISNLDKDFPPVIYDIFKILNNLSDTVFHAYIEKTLKDKRGK